MGEERKEAGALGSDPSSIALVRRIYGAFGRGDVAAILDGLAKDVAWTFHGPASIPYAGTANGTAEVGRWFARLVDAVEFTAFEIRDFVASGNRVVVLGYEEGTAKRSGRSFKTPWVHVWTVDADKVVRFEDFVDSAAVAAALSADARPSERDH